MVDVPTGYESLKGITRSVLVLGVQASRPSLVLAATRLTELPFTGATTYPIAILALFVLVGGTAIANRSRYRARHARRN